MEGGILPELRRASTRRVCICGVRDATVSIKGAALPLLPGAAFILLCCHFITATLLLLGSHALLLVRRC